MQRPLLSVNVNKYALLRNSRGRDVPNLLWAIDLCLASGAHGITVHPRRDERHIRLGDVPVVAEHLRRHHPGIELNVECENHPELIALVLEQRPAQCTLVPVTPGEVTSDHGWLPEQDAEDLAPTLEALRAAGIRSSGFLDCDPSLVAGMAEVGFDRIELYTGPYAWAWGTEHQAVETARFADTAAEAVRHGLGLNAGHDLDSDNLPGIAQVPGLLEVSIGHAQIVRALEVGTATSIRELLTALGW
ncbi:MAG: pyridoxine 5'-phosphate synthase [Deltaproteobacteria bacterium]|nr:MAG: pyridoxine 5'-phosphate synthase [Deltaproteobacteria bacterium]